MTARGESSILNEAEFNGESCAANGHNFTVESSVVKGHNFTSKSSVVKLHDFTSKTSVAKGHDFSRAEKHPLHDGALAPAGPFFPQARFRSKLIKALRAASIATLTPLLCAQTVNLNDLLTSMRKRIETADFRATGHLVWVEPSGARLTYPITIKAHWFPGVLRELVEIGTASKAPGNPPSGSSLATHALLEFRPNGQTSITIAHPGEKSPTTLPIEKWSEGPLGPGFGYEDLLEQQYFWSDQTSEGNAKFGARDCVIVKSTPGASDRTRYALIKTWLDPTIAFPAYVEKTVKQSGVVKEFTYYGIRHEEGVWSAHQVEVKLRGQSGSTLLILDRGSAKANLTLSDFNPALLTKF
jgi:hypothetical protein